MIPSYIQGYPVTSINGYIYNRKYVEIPNTVRSIGALSFMGSSRMESIVIPDSVTEIGDGAFLRCTGLKIIKLPSKLKTLEEELFCGCTALEKVMIPSSVTKIEEGVFAAKYDNRYLGKCSENLKLYYAGSKSQWDAIIFSDYLDFPTYYNAAGCFDGSHNYGDWETALQSTIYADGYKVRKCKNCGAQSETHKIDRVKLTISGVKASAAGKNKVRLTWNATAQAEGYLVYGRRGDGQYGYIGMTSRNAYTDKKALKNAYNFYWVYSYHFDENGKRVVGGKPNYVYGKAK